MSQQAWTGTDAKRVVHYESEDHFVTKPSRLVVLNEADLLIEGNVTLNGTPLVPGPVVPGALSTVKVTQEEYDGGAKDADTLYVVTTTPTAIYCGDILIYQGV